MALDKIDVLSCYLILMKTIQHLLVLVSLLFCTQCKTVLDPTNPVNAPNLVNIALPSAVRLGVAKEPKAAKYLESVATLIDTVVNTGKPVTPDELHASINNLGVDELKSAQAKAAIDMVVTFYKGFYADAVTSSLGAKQVLPLLQAISQSIRKGLA